MKPEIISQQIQEFIKTQIDSMATTNPMINFAKPLITRAVDNKLKSSLGVLNLLADENGEIDAKSIMEDMIDNLITSKPFKLNNSFIGDIEIGGGNIKFNLPMTDKTLVFNQDDLIGFKDALINKDI